MLTLTRTHVLIAGCGVAGLYAALQFPAHIKVTMLSKQGLNLCNSMLAQGGVAAVLDLQNDTPEQHFEDTMIAGAFASNPEAVRILVNEGPGDVRRLADMGCGFDRAAGGELQLTLEGGHSRRRIAHHRDSTGEEMTSTLLKAVMARKNIQIMEYTFIYDLQQIEGGMLACLGTQPPGTGTAAYSAIAADYLIMATGGIGRVFKYTTNSGIATGDGISLASRLGAKIKNLSFIQFHPTAFAAQKGRERFLISEAVRGEGAFLLNCDGKRFMHRYDERLELAPRDVVSKAILLESRRTGSEQFYLDITHQPAAFLKERFPLIYSRCLDEGVNITSRHIPVYPCQHYLMGGIDVDLFSRTRIDRLYAAGECSHTGVHGKNRLASNSLLEALVFGRRAAEHIMALSEFERTPNNLTHATPADNAPLPPGFRTAIREIMQQSYFVLPDPGAACYNLDNLGQINRRLGINKFAVTRDYVEAKSLGTLAALILNEIAGGNL